MEIRYEADSDVLWVQIRDSQGRISGDRLDEYRIVHYDEANEPVAVEFLFVSRGVSLDGVPMAEQIRSAIASLEKALSAA